MSVFIKQPVLTSDAYHAIIHSKQGTDFYAAFKDRYRGDMLELRLNKYGLTLDTLRNIPVHELHVQGDKEKGTYSLTIVGVKEGVVHNVCIYQHENNRLTVNYSVESDELEAYTVGGFILSWMIVDYDKNLLDLLEYTLYTHIKSEAKKH